MQIVVLNGVLSEAEQDAYIRRVTAKYPMSVIEKLILDVQGEYISISCVFHRFRELRKMGGYCISEPAAWNSAKQAEYRDMVPNRFEEDA